LGSAAPNFALPDAVSGKMVTLDHFASSPALLVMFLCNHCPFVKHVRAGVAQLARDYRAKGVGIVGISTNDVQSHPEDSPAKMAEEARAAGYVFPYLYDESQAVAKAYRAACTPDFFLFDKDRRLVYRGQMDDSRPAKYLEGKEIPVTGSDLRAALDATLGGTALTAKQFPSMGCNIKWRPGNEPDYYSH
jgi:thiol-disulfide isomerase/thioredoxin